MVDAGIISNSAAKQVIRTIWYDNKKRFLIACIERGLIGYIIEERIEEELIADVMEACRKRGLIESNG